MYGKSGKKLVIVVPPGTQVVDVETGEVLLDLLTNGHEVLFLIGGRGGLGNVHFKSSVNQRPMYAQGSAVLKMHYFSPLLLRGSSHPIWLMQWQNYAQPIVVRILQALL